MKRRQHLGEMLVQQKVIAADAVETAIEEGRKSGKRLGRVLLEKGLLTQAALASFLEKQLDMPVVDIQAKYALDRRIFKQIPLPYCQDNQIAPLKSADGQLLIAMADPTNFAVIDEVRFMTDAAVDVVLATESSIMGYLSGEGEPARPAPGRARGRRGTEPAAATGPTLGELSFGAVGGDAEALSAQTLAEMADDAPVVRLVNTLIEEAVAKKASDIHIESYERSMRVKYRIDGILYELPDPPARALQPAILSRIKIISKLDISERRLPQDGRIGMEVEGRKIDLRVSIIPGVHGENAVLRILDKGGSLIDLAGLGFEKKEIAMIEEEARRPHGMLLVAGPTGSGKTTTLYSVLQYVRGFERKILTIEDPVEYQLEGVTQVQAHPEIGLDFARGLRAFLRHDPDVIMVGEIRDLETAEIAVRAALTGHLVLSTVHTNDSPSAVTRFVDMGVAPYLVTATFNLVVSQRLVRRICPKCKVRVKLTAARIRELGIKGVFREGTALAHGKGCKACNGSGYSGRFAVFEIMRINDKIRDLVLKGASLGEIRRGARAAGMKSLFDQALAKAKAHETTIDEALRVAGGDAGDFDELF